MKARARGVAEAQEGPLPLEIDYIVMTQLRSIRLSSDSSDAE